MDKSLFTRHLERTGSPSRNRFFELVIRHGTVFSAISKIQEEIPSAELVLIKTVEKLGVPLLYFEQGSGIFFTPIYSNILVVLDLSEFLRINTQIFGFYFEDESRIKLLEKIDASKIQKHGESVLSDDVPPRSGI